MRSFRGFLAPLALLALSCASAAPAPAREGKRALLWEITRPGAPAHPLYLTGSIHMGKPEQFKLPPAAEAAFARADALVVELDPEAANPLAMQQVVFKLGVSAPGTPGLRESVAPETLALLPAALERVGLTEPGVERMRPWLLATMLGVLELHKAGLTEKGGIDLLLLSRARGHKQVVELESVEGQLTALSSLPASVQDLMLREAMKEAPLTAVSLASMAAAWEGGNADALAEVVFEGAKDPRIAPLYESLFYSRNRTMADKLAALIDGQKTYFVAVGAGHAVGPQGIPALLAQRGLVVRQLLAAIER